MVYRIDDSEEARWIDRIREITFREAKQAGASLISRSWVAKKINRSEDFVKGIGRRTHILVSCNKKILEDPVLYHKNPKTS